MSAPARILGIDPGLRVTGYGLLDRVAGRPHVCEAGIIRTPSSESTEIAARILSLYNGIDEIVEQYHPDVVVIEQLYAHYAHPRTAILMGHARGVLLLAAAQRQIPVVSYGATRVKKIITGHGRASKEQMQRTIQRELNLARLPEPNDVSDALGVALCHFYQQQWPNERPA